MNKIKSAENILSENLESANVTIVTEDVALDAMKEYAAQFIDLAAEQIGNHTPNLNEFEGMEKDKESILKIKEQIK